MASKLGNSKTGWEPGLDDQKRYYDKRWTSETWANRLCLARAIAILECLLETGLDGPRILDLGAGTGWLTSILGRFGPATGVELSSVAVEMARSKYPEVRFIECDIFDLAVDRGAYDVVVSQEVIEHVEQQTRYLEIAAQCLKPRGFLILTTPNGWVQAHRTQAELDLWGMQPIENWLSPSQVKRLLWRNFRILRMDSIILGFGSRGICRIVNSVKLEHLVRRLRLGRLFDSARRRFFFGLHMVALCQVRGERNAQEN